MNHITRVTTLLLFLTCVAPSRLLADDPTTPTELLGLYLENVDRVGAFECVMSESGSVISNDLMSIFNRVRTVKQDAVNGYYYTQVNREVGDLQQTVDDQWTILVHPTECFWRFPNHAMSTSNDPTYAVDTYGYISPMAAGLTGFRRIRKSLKFTDVSIPAMMDPTRYVTTSVIDSDSNEIRVYIKPNADVDYVYAADFSGDFGWMPTELTRFLISPQRRVVDEITQVQWIQVQDVWLPTVASFVQTPGGGGDIPKKTLNINFEWVSIKDVFTQDDFAVENHPELLSVTPEETPPKVTELQLNGGDATRSNLVRIEIEFDAVMGLSDVGDHEPINLKNTATGQVFDSESLEISNIGTETTRALITFKDGNGIVGGSLPNGNYEIIFSENDLRAYSGRKLDGDGDGVVGGQYQPPILVFRKYGDFDGDNVVGLLDFNHFRTSFGSSIGDANYKADLDFEGDGVIGLTDFAQFRQTFGT